MGDRDPGIGETQCHSRIQRAPAHTWSRTLVISPAAWYKSCAFGTQHRLANVARSSLPPCLSHGLALRTPCGACTLLHGVVFWDNRGVHVLELCCTQMGSHHTGVTRPLSDLYLSLYLSERRRSRSVVCFYVCPRVRFFMCVHALGAGDPRRPGRPEGRDSSGRAGKSGNGRRWTHCWTSFAQRCRV